MTTSLPLRPQRPANRRRATHLILTIDEAVYAVHPSVCDPSAADRVIRLLKANGSSYNVAQTEHGPRCDCPDFVFRRDGLDPMGCKHIQALVQHGLIENPYAGALF